MSQKLVARAILAAGVFAISFAFPGLRSEAQVYSEIGDAGQTTTSAQNTGAVSGVGLTTILGNISGIDDADLFRFSVTSPTTFSASTVNSVTGVAGLDTALFLFNNSGAPIYTNDDASGLSVQSTLPGGTSFTFSLSPGTYYLGISLSGNEPVNVFNQLLFASFPGGSTTAVRGPASGINPTSLSNFSNGAFAAQTGAYQIDLTGSATAAVPEPSTTGLVVMASAIAVLAIRRRYQAC